MLESLKISGFALIDSLEVHWTPGLNCIIGETGAGKSILVDALDIVSGGRAYEDQIRRGENRCEIEAQFARADGAKSIIRRVIRRDGKNKALLNGVPVSLQTIRQFTNDMLDIQVQFENQSLLNEQNHILYVDEYAGLQDLRAKFASGYREYSAKKRALTARQLSKEERAAQLNIYTFQYEEIMHAEIQENEYEKMRAEYELLSRCEERKLLAQEISQALSSEPEVSGFMQLVALKETVKRLADLDAHTHALAGRYESALIEIEDIAEAVQTYSEEIVFDEERYRMLEERIALFERLAKKYDRPVRELNAYAQTLKEKIDDLQSAAKGHGELEQEVQHLYARARDQAVRLSEKRCAVASKIAQNITAQLHDLYLPDALCKISVTQNEAAMDVTGIDTVVFLISMNKGEAVKPLKRVASGGELSRLLLALKILLHGKIPTLVFDEIDVGLSGQAGRVLAEKLRALSRTRQVLCITHLPTVAAAADTLLAVKKQSLRERAVILADHVRGDEKLSEIARMIQGESVSETVKQEVKNIIRSLQK